VEKQREAASMAAVPRKRVFTAGAPLSEEIIIVFYAFEIIFRSPEGIGKLQALVYRKRTSPQQAFCGERIPLCSKNSFGRNISHV
jgi:hypothetical protein